MIPEQVLLRVEMPEVSKMLINSGVAVSPPMLSTASDVIILMCTRAAGRRPLPSL